MEGIQDFTRKLVIAHLHDTGMSLNELAKVVEVSQPNLHVFVNGKGLAVKSIEKLWKYFGVQYDKI